MNQREKGFTQGVGCAIHYVAAYDKNVAERLFLDMNLPLKDYEEVYDEIDLPYIRKSSRGVKNETT